MIKYVFKFLLIIFPHAIIYAQNLSFQTQQISFSQFLQLVEKNHPAKKEDDLEIKKAQLLPEKTGKLSDPMLSMSRNNVPLISKDTMNDNSYTQPSEWGLSIAQEFPWFGALEAQKQAANASSLDTNIIAQKNNLLRKVSAANLYIDIVTLKQKIKIEKETIKETENLLRYLGKHYSASTISHTDFLTLEITKEEQSSNLTAIEAQFSNLQMVSKYLLNQQVEFFNLPKNLEIQQSFKEENDIYLKKISNLKQVKILSLTAQQKQLLPKFTTTFQIARQDTGMIMGGAMLGINIPIYSTSIRNSIELESSLEQSSLQVEIENYKQAKEATLNVMQKQINTTQELLDKVTKVILPLVTEHLRAVEVDYAQGKIRIAQLVEAKQSALKQKENALNLQRQLLKELVKKAQINAGGMETNDLLTAAAENSL